MNNIVDITNYVMLEMGQPLHAFDRATLQGDQIIVQDFDDSITFETLDHIERNCPAGTLFICDGDAPIAIAGVMGGVDSEVSDRTTDVVLESAYFGTGSIRKTAKQQTLQTDASYRFERGVDPTIQRIAAERAAELMAEIAGGTVQNYCSDVHPNPYEYQKITLRKSYTNRLLGTQFSVDEITDLLHGLELSIVDQDDESVTYRIPAFRPDLQREVDLIEEVGRLYDYNNIPRPEHGTFTSPEAFTKWEQLNNKIKEVAKGLRFREIYSNSLISEEVATRFSEPEQMLHTLNPISADMTTLRPSLLPGFLESAAYNFNRKASQVRFFEMGHVFEKSDNGQFYSGIGEEAHVLFGLAGLKTIEHWSTEPQEYSVFDLKAVINSFLSALHLEQYVTTDVNDDNHLLYFINDQQIGRLYAVEETLKKAFDLDQPSFAAEFSITRIYDAQKQLSSDRYEPVSKFPSFEFDFAVIVDSGLRASALQEQIEKTTGDNLDEIQVFDVFEGESLGENKKSIAFRLSFLDKNKTLTIKDVEPIIENVLKVLDDKFSAKLRS